MSVWGDIKTEPLTGRLVKGWKGELQGRGYKEGHGVRETCTSLSCQTSKNLTCLLYRWVHYTRTVERGPLSAPQFPDSVEV